MAYSSENPKGRGPRACTWVKVKGEYFLCFYYHIYPALGQAKLESLKNHELARGYLAASLVLASLLSGVGGTRAYYSDGETSASNNFVARVSTLWCQTTQNDFNAGVLIDTDTSANPGNVQLDATCSSGSLASQVLNIGVNGAAWDALC